MRICQHAMPRTIGEIMGDIDHGGKTVAALFKHDCTFDMDLTADDHGKGKFLKPLLFKHNIFLVL